MSVKRTTLALACSGLAGSGIAYLPILYSRQLEPFYSFLNHYWRNGGYVAWYALVCGTPLLTALLAWLTVSVPESKLEILRKLHVAAERHLKAAKKFHPEDDDLLHRLEEICHYYAWAVTHPDEVKIEIC